MLKRNKTTNDSSFKANQRIGAALAVLVGGNLNALKGAKSPVCHVYLMHRTFDMKICACKAVSIFIIYP